MWTMTLTKYCHHPNNDQCLGLKISAMFLVFVIFVWSFFSRYDTIPYLGESMYLATIDSDETNETIQRGR